MITNKTFVFIFILLNTKILSGFIDCSLINFNASNLADHFRKYKVTIEDAHAGDLFEHSVWVTQITERWFIKKKFWTNGLDESDARLAIIAAFLHDIGKAGDLFFYYPEKRNHPTIGFEYLINKKKFFIDDEELFDVAAWFRVNNVTDEEQKIIAILAAVHREFGLVLMRIVQGEKEEIVFKDFLHEIATYAKKANYNNGNVDKKLVLLSILINVADVKGISNPSYWMGSTLNLPLCKPTHAVFRNAYRTFHHKTKGREVREKLIEYFNTKA